LSPGLQADFLRREGDLAHKEVPTPDCRWENCSNCGVCPGLKVTNSLVEGTDLA